MKIWCQLPVWEPLSANEPSYELLQKDYNMIKREDTDIVIRDVPTGLRQPDLISYLGLRQINDREILKSMLRAQDEGFDAVAGACYFDGGIRAAANLMDIPVVGPGETSMYFARIIGNRFAIITSDFSFVAEITRHMEELNMISSAISYYPVRHLTLGKTFFEARSRGDYSPIIEDFKNIAQECIKDGADVLIVGCGALSPVLTVNSVTEIDGAPIIDPIQVSLKFAEILVDFKASGMPIASNKGLFLKASKDNILNVRKSLGLI